MCSVGFQTNNRDEKAVDLVTGDKNEDEEKDKKPRFEAQTLSSQRIFLISAFACSATANSKF